MKKIKILGKSIPVLVLVLLGLGLVSGALLTYYGQIKATVNVHQSILLDNVDVNTGSLEIKDTFSEPAPGGEKFCFKHFLKNQASVEADVLLETTYSPTLTDNEIVTTYYTMPETTELTLCAKSPTNWQCIEGGAIATLTFDTVNPTFDYTLTATGLQVATQYAIIYYADKPDRFVDWGGDNPGKLIDTFTTVGTSYSTSGVVSVNLDMNLPKEPDANIDEYDYYVSDGYVHCHGAKIWIVPTSDLTDGKLTAWNPSKYLFETDLITYFDCDINELTSNYPVEEYGIDSSEITLESGEEKPFFVCYDFDIRIWPGTYTITTGIKPVLE